MRAAQNDRGRSGTRVPYLGRLGGAWRPSLLSAYSFAKVPERNSKLREAKARVARGSVP
jgi:hypothetical protein